MSRFARLTLFAALLSFTACPDESSPAGSASDRSGAETPATPAAARPATGESGGTAAAPGDEPEATTPDAGAPMDAGAAAAPAPASEGELYATFQTSLGDIVVRLFPKDAPKTVQNFVELATGKKQWKDPRTNKQTSARLYDGTIFHRVIPNFMIQGGDPLGQGIGGPGYEFEDEFQSGRRFDKKGLLAMANRGPNTNGSQFFITVSTPAHLNDKHTIFGEVVSGYEVVEKISTVPTSARNRPATDVVIKKVIISDKQPQVR